MHVITTRQGRAFPLEGEVSDEDGEPAVTLRFGDAGVMVDLAEMEKIAAFFHGLVQDDSGEDPRRGRRDN